MGMLHYSVQLHDERTGAAIITSGGTITVCASGDAAKQTLYTKAGAALANPVAINYGKIEFWVADTVNQVDLYGIGPNGEAIILTGVKPGGDAALYLSKSLQQTYKLPFAIGDTAANTETDTGHDLVPGSIVHGIGGGVRVTTADSGITIDVGLLSGESGGDADGFMDGVSVASAATVKPTLTNGGATLGALLKVQDSANAGDVVPEAHVVATAKSVSYTLAASADTAEGFILLPVTLPA